MTTPFMSGQLEPLASPPLRRRFPQLDLATDGCRMRAHIQRALFDCTRHSVEACGRPRAEVRGQTCWLQYPVVVRALSGERRDVLVVGAMFTDAGTAEEFERTRLVPLVAHRGDSAGPAPRTTAFHRPLRMALSLFPVVASLPTLADAADPDRVSTVLESILGRGERPVVTAIELVRLRRTRGCVLRYRVMRGRAHTVLYGKVGYATAAESIRSGLDALARCTDPGHADAVAFPRVLGHAPELDLTLVPELPGSRPDLRVESARNEVVDAAALVAASIHTSGVAAGGSRTFDTERSRARVVVNAIAEDAPVLAAWLTRVLDSLDPLVAATAPHSSVLGHGDFTPSQLLLDGPRVAVLDFDGLCQAEPAFDLGRFIAYLRVALAKAGSDAADVLALRFLETYRARRGQPGVDARAAVYTTTSLVRMAAHSWQQLKPDRLQLVCRVLDEHVARLGLLAPIQGPRLA